MKLRLNYFVLWEQVHWKFWIGPLPHTNIKYTYPRLSTFTVLSCLMYSWWLQYNKTIFLKKWSKYGLLRQVLKILVGTNRHCSADSYTSAGGNSKPNLMLNPIRLYLFWRHLSIHVILNFNFCLFPPATAKTWCGGLHLFGSSERNHSPKLLRRHYYLQK